MGQWFVIADLLNGSESCTLSVDVVDDVVRLSIFDSGSHLVAGYSLTRSEALLISMAIDEAAVS